MEALCITVDGTKFMKPMTKDALAATMLVLCFVAQLVPARAEDAVVESERDGAERGDPFGQYFLGLFYWEGKGVPQDYIEAVKWFRKAADQGFPAAQYMLGAIYGLGQGVPLDFVRAHMWLNLSGAQGNQDATEVRDTIAKQMTPAQIAEAQRLAREWKPK
jgi:uncharacterized protein